VDRSDSEAFWHSGSFWRLCIQVPVNREPNMGVYLQRLSTNYDKPFDPHEAPFMDKRAQVAAWFRIYCFVGNSCYLLESRPDTFKDNQSWGWQSQTLYKEVLLDGHKQLKCSVVMGMML
jgi:hypothetical protein